MKKRFFIMFLINIIAIVLFSINTKIFATTTINDKIANDETTIILNEDLEEDIEVLEGKTVIIDLNGHTLTTASQSGTRGIINHGNLTIKATKGGTLKNGNETNGSYGIIDNYGMLTLDGGTFIDYGQADGSSFKNRGGTIIINGGDFTSNSTGKGNACVYSDGRLTIADGATFKANSTGAYAVIVNTGSATIGNISVEGVKGGFAVNSGDVTINGGTYKGNNYYGIWVTNDGHSTVTINEGTFIGKYGLYTAVDDGNQDVGDTNIIINGGTFTGTEKSAVSMNKNGSLRNWGMTIKGGNYSTDNVNDYVAEGYCIYTKDLRYIVDKVGDISTTKSKIIIPVDSSESLDLLLIEDLRKYLTISSLNTSVAEVVGETVKGIAVGNSKVVANLNNGKTAEIDVIVYKTEAKNADEENNISANNQVSRICK